MNKTSEENKTGMNRRDFLRQAGYSALGGMVATAIPKSVGAALTPDPFVGKLLLERSTRGLHPGPEKGLYEHRHNRFHATPCPEKL